MIWNLSIKSSQIWVNTLDLGWIQPQVIKAKEIPRFEYGKHLRIGWFSILIHPGCPQVRGLATFFSLSHQQTERFVFDSSLVA
jgi:hypothetical protein